MTFAANVDRRELGLEKYASLLRERVRENILLTEVASEKAPLLPVVRRKRQ